MTISHFYGLPTGVLQNEHLRLEYLTEVGPRIVRLFRAKSQENILAELPEFKLETPLGEYYFRGGHRLWHSPENFPRTYVPDNGPIKVEEIPGGVKLSQPMERLTAISKKIEITLDSTRPIVRLTHELRNEGPWSVEFAPWALTQLRLGGIIILPQAVGNADPLGLLPNRHLVFWPYTSIADSRLHLTDEAVYIWAQPRLPAVKVGCYNPHGWMAYWQEGVTFVKRFEPIPAIQASGEASRWGEEYPDLGCNTEAYCGDQFVEMESLGPRQYVQPGQSITHIETWEVYENLEFPYLTKEMLLKVEEMFRRVASSA